MPKVCCIRDGSVVNNSIPILDSNLDKECSNTAFFTLEIVVNSRNLNKTVIKLSIGLDLVAHTFNPST